MVKTLVEKRVENFSLFKLVDASILFSERVGIDVFCLLRLFIAFFQNCACFFSNDFSLCRYLHFLSILVTLLRHLLYFS